MDYQNFSAIIIGSGLAGLYSALKISQNLQENGKVLLVTKADLGESNSRYAQGGIVAVLKENTVDSVASHISDTLNAGAGLSDFNTVKYFSENGERTFPRTRAIIDRAVSNCHPPKSVHIVEKIVEDFKAGKKDNEDFWIKLGEQYVLIRYFAVRNSQGEYLGVLEVTQNIKPIQEITGEKRLMSD